MQTNRPSAALFKQGVTVNLINDGAPHRPAQIRAQWQGGIGSVSIVRNDNVLTSSVVVRLSGMPDALALGIRYCASVHGCEVAV